MNDDPKQMIRYMSCDTHGQTKWQGHIMCDHCGRVYQTKLPDKARYPPETCQCGQKLMPPKDVAIGSDVLGKHADGVMFDGHVMTKTTTGYADWQARPICWLCFRRYDRKHKGRVPNWVSTPDRRN